MTAPGDPFRRKLLEDSTLSRIHIECPSILWPKPLWTGKQVSKKRHEGRQGVKEKEKEEDSVNGPTSHLPSLSFLIFFWIALSLVSLTSLRRLGYRAQEDIRKIQRHAPTLLLLLPLRALQRPCQLQRVRFVHDPRPSISCKQERERERETTRQSTRGGGIPARERPRRRRTRLLRTYTRTHPSLPKGRQGDECIQNAAPVSGHVHADLFLSVCLCVWVSERLAFEEDCGVFLSSLLCGCT